MGVKDVFSDYEDYETEVVGELRSQRRGADITLKEMSEKIGLHVNTISKCERQESGLGLDILFGYSKVLGRSLETFVSIGKMKGKPAGNPVSELTEEEMCQYSQLLQSLFNAFTEYGIKLTGKRSAEVTRMAAVAIIDQRQD
jgi:transcriptional regulator with XRE-family HTH domain